MSEKNKGKLYLLPNTISESPVDTQLHDGVKNMAESLDYFICEHAKNLRAFLKRLSIPSPYDHLRIHELNKHTDRSELPSFLKPALDGHDIGLVSDAGCPGIADPGADVVRMAHDKGIQVVPMVGPSSLLLTLMASGLNGQRFAFHGYLPQKEGALKQRLKELEAESRKTGVSQLFIETPYRNERLMSHLLKYLHPSSLLCIGIDITGADEFVLTRPVAAWKKSGVQFNKRPCVFILGSQSAL